MPRKKIVKENTNLEKDMFTGAILNRDRNAYKQAVRRKHLRKKKETELQDLKSQVSELASLVKTLTKKIDK
jgi:uncharacterized protein YlxW (UPF0749 family)